MLNVFLLFCSSVVLSAQRQADDWWDDMGDSSWETSNYLASDNPYYNMYRQSAAQMDWYSYAQHVGKINSGQSVNPEINMPRHRAFGYQSDFNPQDLKSGAFNYKPQGQKFQAAAVHVNLGLANHVGEIRTMPAGQHVQADGTVLVETSPRQRSPCHPDPCKHLAFSTCSTVNDVTAKCSDSGKVQLILTSFDLSDNDEPNRNSLIVFPDFHNGSACTPIWLEGGDSWNKKEECGVVDEATDDSRGRFTISSRCPEEGSGWLIPRPNYFCDDGDGHDEDSDPVDYIISLTKTPDGSNYRDYTYAVTARVAPDNPSISRTQLRVTVDGEDRQVLAVPQWDGTTNVNWDGRNVYFFGCFRPQTGLVDTRGAGFYYNLSPRALPDGLYFPGLEVFAGLGVYDSGLCKALQGWTDGPGFNPYVPGFNVYYMPCIMNPSPGCVPYVPGPPLPTLFDQ